MGLFGASWEWEEIKKKDAIMGELRKENDRILSEKRKENDRILKEQRKENDRLNRQLNNKAKYENIDVDALKSRLAFEKEVKSSRKWEFLTKFRSLLSANKYLTSYKSVGEDTTSCLIVSTVVLVFNIFGIIPLIIMLFNKNIDSFLRGIILTIGLYFIFQTIRILWNMPNVLYNKSRIKKSKCYKEIFLKANEIGARNIKNIYVSSKKVVIETIDYKTIIITYSSLNFPNLPLNKQAILLGTLISDLKGSFYFGVETCINGLYKEDNPEHLKPLSLKGYNKKIKNNENKAQKKKIKDYDIEHKEKLKKGETW